MVKRFFENLGSFPDLSSLEQGPNFDIKCLSIQFISNISFFAIDTVPFSLGPVTQYVEGWPRDLQVAVQYRSSPS